MGMGCQGYGLRGSRLYITYSRSAQWDKIAEMCAEMWGILWLLVACHAGAHECHSQMSPGTIPLQILRISCAWCRGRKKVLGLARRGKKRTPSWRLVLFTMEDDTYPVHFCQGCTMPFNFPHAILQFWLQKFMLGPNVDIWEFGANLKMLRGDKLPTWMG